MGKTLLLADDSVTIQKVVGITFASEDFDLVTVDNGDDALRRAIEIRPDLILADIGMPGLDGYELCGEIRKRTELAHVPVLLLTGTFEIFDEKRAEAVGANAYISKPFEAKALVDQVYALLARSATPEPSQPEVEVVATPAAIESVAATAAPTEAPDLPSSDFFEFDEPITQTRVVPDSPGLDSDALPWPQAPDLLDTDEEQAAPVRLSFPAEEFSFDGLDFDAPSTTGSGETAIFGEPHLSPASSGLSPMDAHSIDPAAALTAYLDAEVQALDDAAPIWVQPESTSAASRIDDPSGILGESPDDSGGEELCPTWAVAIAQAEAPADLPEPAAIEDIDLVAEEEEFPLAVASSLEGDPAEPALLVAEIEDDPFAIEEDTQPEALFEPHDEELAFTREPEPESDTEPASPAPAVPMPTVQIDQASLHAALEKVAWEAFGALSEQLVHQVVAKVEEIAWEVVPQIAERLIQEEIARLEADSESE